MLPQEPAGSLLLGVLKCRSGKASVGKCGGRSDPAAGGESPQPLENREGFHVPLPSPVHLQLLLHEEALICGIFTCPA